MWSDFLIADLIFIMIYLVWNNPISNNSISDGFQAMIQYIISNDYIISNIYIYTTKY